MSDDLLNEFLLLDGDIAANGNSPVVDGAASSTFSNNFWKESQPRAHTSPALGLNLCGGNSSTQAREVAKVNSSLQQGKADAGKDKIFSQQANVETIGFLNNDSFTLQAMCDAFSQFSGANAEDSCLQTTVAEATKMMEASLQSARCNFADAGASSISDPSASFDSVTALLREAGFEGPVDFQQLYNVVVQHSLEDNPNPATNVFATARSLHDFTGLLDPLFEVPQKAFNSQHEPQVAAITSVPDIKSHFTLNEKEAVVLRAQTTPKRQDSGSSPLTSSSTPVCDSSTDNHGLAFPIGVPDINSPVIGLNGETNTAFKRDALQYADNAGKAQGPTPVEIFDVSTSNEKHYTSDNTLRISKSANSNSKMMAQELGESDKTMRMVRELEEDLACHPIPHYFNLSNAPKELQDDLAHCSVGFLTYDFTSDEQEFNIELTDFEALAVACRLAKEYQPKLKPYAYASEADARAAVENFKSYRYVKGRREGEKTIYDSTSRERFAKIIGLDPHGIREIEFLTEDIANQLNILINGDRISRNKKNVSCSSSPTGSSGNNGGQAKSKPQTWNKQPKEVKMRLYSVLKRVLWDQFRFPGAIVEFITKRLAYYIAQNRAKARKNNPGKVEKGTKLNKPYRKNILSKNPKAIRRR